MVITSEAVCNLHSSWVLSLFFCLVWHHHQSLSLGVQCHSPFFRSGAQWVKTTGRRWWNRHQTKWLGGVKARASDLWSRGYVFNSWPFNCHVPILGRLFPHMVLLPSSIICYWLWCCEVGKVITGLAESNGSLTLVLWLKSPAHLTAPRNWDRPVKHGTAFSLSLVGILIHFVQFHLNRNGLSFNLLLCININVIYWVNLSFHNTKVLHQTLNPTAELWCKTLSQIKVDLVLHRT